MEIKKEKQGGQPVPIDLINKAKTFNLSPETDIYEEGEWIFMFLLPKSKEDIEIMNQLYKSCRNSILAPAFSEHNIGELIAMEYMISDGEIDWTCFYNIREIVKYNTQNKYDVVSVD